jgi:hypothetical protein
MVHSPALLLALIHERPRRDILGSFGLLSAGHYALIAEGLWNMGRGEKR